MKRSRSLFWSVIAVALVSIGVARPLHTVYAAEGNESSTEGSEGHEGSPTEGQGSSNEGASNGEAGQGGSEGQGNEGAQGSEGSEGSEGNEGSAGEGAEGGSEGNNEGSEGEGQEPGGGYSQDMIDAGLLSQVEDWYVTLQQLAHIQVNQGANQGLKTVDQAIMAGWASKISTLGTIFANLGLDTVEPGEVVTFQQTIQDLAATTDPAQVDAKAKAALQDALSQGIAFTQSKVGSIHDAAAKAMAQQMITEWQGYQSALAAL